MTEAVNLWTGAAHATAYLERRDQMPYGAQGYAVLLEFLPDVGMFDAIVSSFAIHHVVA